ncbi:Uu.00g045230.m01.CDS01 [Anthostomella pinea]|uniref:Uu.00g045230.m01.CDS01 n=1 Tax=Anthostomella pinea TaxID=933095 RepID=A0AAI8VC25_9PEZI|nr:Uu.00g045230.m01.CDS01 [Anthostomella pinea]
MAGTMKKDPFDGPPPPYDADNDSIAAFAAVGGTANSDGKDGQTTPRQGVLSKMVAFLQTTALCGSSATASKTATNELSDSRRRWIDVGSQSYTAQLDLYDLLSIRSWSGSLNIGVTPQAADKEHPAPAEMMIESHSGSLDINMAAFEVPKRDYFVSIDSHSGSVGGHLIHGRKTAVVAHSASISLRFTLSGASEHASSLSTATQSGQSTVTVLNPVHSAGASSSIKQLSSNHTTKSGSLVLRYPSDWEGTIEGRTHSGGLQLQGRGIEIIRREPHYVLAKKGTGDSNLNFETWSGSASVYFD